MATTTTITTSTITTPSSTPPNSANSLTPSFGMGHQRSKSLLTSGAKSPNDFVFPRRPPSVTGNILTRPRSGTTDAITLLAEIGVLPPPIVTPGSGRMRAPQTPYHVNGQRPQSMLALPTPPLPVTVTLAPAPGGRSHRRVTSDLPSLEPPTAAVKEEETPVKKGPPPGYQRRGHAHRRSGAISSSDVWGLLSQSAPSLPLPHGPQAKDGSGELSSGAPSPVQSWSAPVSPGVSSTPPPASVPSPSPSPQTPDHLDARRSNKVAFTDKIEIIPRPLSVASSLATVRAHGAQDSISSIADFAPQQPRTPTTGLNRSPTRSRSSSISSSTSPLSAELQAQFSHITQRPSTAGAILASPKLMLPTEPVPVLKIEPVMFTQPSPAASNVATPSSPLKLSPSIAKKTHKKALSDGSPQTASPSGSDFFGNCKSEEDAHSPKSKKGGKRKKKHLKNFLFGKGGSEKQTKHGKTGRPLKRSPTPPSRTNSFRNQNGQIEVLPAWNESYVYMPESSMAGRSLEELSSTMSPRYNHPSGDRDSPVIDLDAALGPFDSPALGSASKSSGGFSAAKKRMHSSGAGGKLGIATGIGAGLGSAGFGAGFVGTHRRSESMPDMPLFALEENARMEMDDVFEEDEEEEYSSSGSDDGSESDESEDGRRRMSTGNLGIGIQVVDGDGNRSWEDGMTMDWSSPSSRGRRSSLAPTVGSTNGSLRNESIREEDEPQEDAPTNKTQITIAITHDYDSLNYEEPPSPRSPTSSIPSAQSSTSTVTPTSAVSASTVPTLPDTPVTSIAPESLSTPSTPSQLPSNFTSSRNNSLTLKELAALSSLHDPELELYADPEFRFLGEPGPEMRMSVDDVPSLTSSSSTMTSSYAAYCVAGMQPSTPRAEETLGVVMPVDKNGKTKSIKKKWSKVFKFWESEDKKKDKEKEHSPKVEKEKKEKSVKEKKHKEKERI